MTESRAEKESLVTGYSGRVFLLLTITFITIKITQRLLPPLLPAIIDDLGITAFLAGIALTLLRITRASMQYPGGRVSDQLSRITVLLPSLLFSVVGLAFLSIPTGYLLFLFGIFLFGIGLGLFDPSARATLTDLFDEKRGRAFGLHLMGGDSAGILAAGISIWIVSVATWRAAFLPLLALLLPAPFLMYRLSREPIGVSRIDLGVRATAGRLLANSRMRWLLVVYSLFVFSISAVVGFLPTFLSEIHGFSFALASSAYALLYVVGTVAKPVAGTASDRLPRLRVVLVGLLCGGGGLALLVFAPTSIIAVVGVVIYAIGHTAIPPPLQAYLMDRFPDDNIGGDFGAVRMTYLAIGSLGPAYVGLVASKVGYVPAFTSIVGCFLLAGVILVWLSR
jgi:predicted MFS family arabinose efflux permease